MKVIVLSSGSKGNTTYIECNGTKILIDMGNTCKYVTDKLRGIGVRAEEIDAIFITHTHSDHIKGLKVFCKKYNTLVYFTDKMRNELSYIDNYKLIDSDIIKLKDLVINVIKTSHDASDSVGYVIEGNNKGIVYITDTGYINNKYFDILTNREVYIMESNHDIEMLNNGTVTAAKSGCAVGNASCNGRRGNYVTIDHNIGGYTTIYMHMDKVNVKVGQVVSRGQKIGTMGNTGEVYPVPTSSRPYSGTHLHFAVHRYGSAINPMSLY